jgi:predicted nucleotidyltransferase
MLHKLPLLDIIGVEESGITFLSGGMSMVTPVNTKDDIRRRLSESSRKLSSLGVTAIGLFGSFAKGRQTPTSDVDILVEFAPDQHSFDNFMDLAFFLEELLGRRVELVTRESLSPYIAPHILSEVERVAVAA